MEDKITLDRKAFKVLSSDTRVDILKYLGKRRMTLTELSKRLGMSASTVKEHLGNLSEAGLVEQKDDGHKWKYYELTRKGKGILSPMDNRVFLVLASSMAVMLGSLYSMFTRVPQSRIWANTKDYFAPTADILENDGAAGAAPPVPQAVAEEAANTIGTVALPVLEITLIFVSILLIMVSLGYIVRKKGLL
jgi:DNA-binding transcriptional ArsR family regulator